MTAPDTASADLSHGMRAPGTAAMIVGGVVGAIAAYLFQVLGGQALGERAFAPIGALWTAVFIIATIVLIPLEQYATREVSKGRNPVRQDGTVIAGVVMAAVVVGTGFVLATRDLYFEGKSVYAVQMAVMMLGFGLLFVGRGMLAGARRFRVVGWLLAAESSIRLVLAAVVALIGGGAVWFGWAMVSAPFVVMGVRFWRDPGDSTPPDRAVRFLAAYASGSAASQLLLAASPLAVGFLGGGAALFSIVFMTFTLFRAPLTLIYSLQGRLLSLLVRLVEEGDRHRLRIISAATAGSAFVLTAAAWFVGGAIGPAVVRLLAGPGFDPDPSVAGYVAAGVVAASGAQITGQVLVAQGRTGRLAVSWAAGLMLALAIMVFPAASPDVRVAQAFAAGELTALCFVGVTVLRFHRRDVWAAPARSRRATG